jgi:hypothetical protein
MHYHSLFFLTVGDGASGSLSSKHQTEYGNNPKHVDVAGYGDKPIHLDVDEYAGMKPNGNPPTEYGSDYYGHGKKR